MGWFTKNRAARNEKKRTLGEGIFRRCENCGETRTAEEFNANIEVCPGCGFHYRLSGEAWLDLLLDPGSWTEAEQALVSMDPLGFKDSKRYPDRIKAAIKKTGVNDAVLTGTGAIEGRPVEMSLLLFRFLGGSMGSVVGEKITTTFERAAERRHPAVVLSSSGGARMQEGVLSLMQMAKTAAALGRMRDEGVPFVSVLLDPTTGGVAASYALLGDVNIAEPRARIGFAGARVIENTIRQKLPEGFQRSEFLLEHGMLDMIAERREMRATIARVLSHLVG
ncbi:MAG: acetyl-CoA carboxylase, carboxyltransferase subunit beta [Proteobacteria bacterium]|nr:acetyl-CoA carboxylase, carboxyltransferase subunit beta [Pseudomonadota bacterium]